MLLRFDLLRIWNWCLVEILKMKFDQDLCLNLWYDLKKLLWQDELNPRVRCAFGNVSTNIIRAVANSILQKKYLGCSDF